MTILTDVDSAKEYLDSFDFMPIIRKMVIYEGWRLKDAIKTCDMYKKYILLIKKHGAKYNLTPSKEIDIFLHHHILHSEAYIDMCNKIFDGSYLHHYPYFGIDGKSTVEDLRQNFLKTQKLFFNEYNEYILPTKFKYRNILRLGYFFLAKLDSKKLQKL
ncbi:MAG: hypothetical protein V4591_01555 [Bdellovibrionota bacterium]